MWKVWLYLAAFIAGIVIFVIVIKKFKKAKKDNSGSYRKGRIPFAIIVFVMFEANAIGGMLLPPGKELETTGKYSFTSEDYWLTTNQVAADGKNRELQVRVWYPSNYDKGDHTARTIVFSHGSCGTIDNNLSLYRELASHGYIVLAVGHEGQAAVIERSDGTSVSVDDNYLNEVMKINPSTNPEDAYGIFSKWMKERTDDLNLVLDDFKNKTEESVSAYSRIANSTEYIIAGHSVGGSAAYAIARLRDDICGCIALESPFMYDIKGVENGEYVFDSSDYNMPLLNVYTDSSYSHLAEWKQYGNNEHFLTIDDPKYTNIYYPGTGHMGICDLSLVSPLAATVLGRVYPKVPEAEQLQMLNEDCLKFLSATE